MINEHDLHDYRQLTMKQPKANDIQIGGDHYKKPVGETRAALTILKRQSTSLRNSLK